MSGNLCGKMMLVGLRHSVISTSSCDQLVTSVLQYQLCISRFSGITKDDLSAVTTTLKDVQEKLKKIIPPDAILVGHSLEFDFASLRVGTCN